MKLLAYLAAAMAIIVSASAVPAPAGTKPPSSNPNDYKQFYLKTQLLPGQKNPRFNNTYVQLYHTGAGLNDAVLTKKQQNTVTSYLNGTQLLFNVPEGTQPFYPWGAFMIYEVAYAGWEPMQINVGNGKYGKFFINGTGLQFQSDPKYPKTNSFAGWRVCDWWHNVPQLFWLLSYYNNTTPTNCADVRLMPVYVK